MARPLTKKQAAFVVTFDGDATNSAKRAGYNGNQNSLAKIGHELLQHTEVVRQLKERDAKENKPRIASRLKRQQFWSEVMLDISEDMKHRLKASELLGRSEADFIEKINVTGMSLEDLVGGSMTDQERGK